MAAEATEATESLPKEAGLVGLDGPLDQLDLTKMLAESFEPQEQERSEETSPGGDAVEEADDEMEYAGHIARDASPTEKLAEGICRFAADTGKLEGFLSQS